MHPLHLIVSDYFKMHMIDYNGPSNYGVDRVGVLTNVYTLNGGFLLKNGTTTNDPLPWYMHPFGVLAGSEGCIGPMSSLACKGLWNDLDTKYTGAWYMDQLLAKMEEYGIYNGYEINMHLSGRVRP